MKTIKINDLKSHALTNETTSVIFGGNDIPPCTTLNDPIADAINEALEDYYAALEAAEALAAALMG